MESSIAEFLMRQLASEQLPTSHACKHDTRRLACAWKYLSLSPLHALRSGKRPTHQAPFAGRCIDGCSHCAIRAATFALTNALDRHTFSAFWL